MPRLRQPRENQEKKPQLLSQELFEKPDGEQIVNDEAKPFGAADADVVDQDKKSVDKGVAEPDAAEELRKQIEALKKGEAEQRRRADQAEQERQQARQEALARAAEAERFKADATTSRASEIERAIAAETEAAEAAKREYLSARNSGDMEAELAALDRMTQSRAKLETLKVGKAAIDSEIQDQKKEAEKPKQQQTAPTVEQTIDSWGLPKITSDWLKARPEYVTNQRLRAKLTAIHYDALDAKHVEHSPAYFEYIETQLGMRKAPEKDEPEEQTREAIVSAPVSREVPDNSGKRSTTKITLTAEQREFARIAGITETEYAKQLAELNKQKANGNYGERR